jgi:hypothetical protein
MSHTKEPWIYTRIEAQSGSDNHEPYSVWLFDKGPRSVRIGNTTFIHADDMRRIVACVNACAGISTEELEKASEDPKHKDLIFNGAKLILAKRDAEEQRDELLELLQEIVQEADEYIARTGNPVHNWLDSARDAIKKISNT